MAFGSKFGDDGDGFGEPRRSSGPDGGGGGGSGDGGGGGDGTGEAASKALTSRVSRMLSNIEAELDKVERSISGKMRLLDADNDGIISQKELEHAVRFLREQLSPEELQALYSHLGEKAGVPGSFEVDRLLELAASDAALEPQPGDKGAEKGDPFVKIHIK